jgi:prophage regulatory protein
MMVDLPAPDRLLSTKEVLARVRIGQTTLYRRLRQGRFPLPVRHGDANLWRESTINAWIAGLPEHGVRRICIDAVPGIQIVPLPGGGIAVALVEVMGPETAGGLAESIARLVSQPAPQVPDPPVEEGL